MVKALCFHCRGCRFDPWLGKFLMPGHPKEAGYPWSGVRLRQLLQGLGPQGYRHLWLWEEAGPGGRAQGGPESR